MDWPRDRRVDAPEHAQRAAAFEAPPSLEIHPWITLNAWRGRKTPNAAATQGKARHVAVTRDVPQS